jgi:hypothetical protein
MASCPHSRFLSYASRGSNMMGAQTISEIGSQQNGGSCGDCSSCPCKGGGGAESGRFDQVGGYSPGKRSQSGMNESFAKGALGTASSVGMGSCPNEASVTHGAFDRFWPKGRPFPPMAPWMGSMGREKMRRSYQAKLNLPIDSLQPPGSILGAPTFGNPTDIIELGFPGPTGPVPTNGDGGGKGGGGKGGGGDDEPIDDGGCEDPCKDLNLDKMCSQWCIDHQMPPDDWTGCTLEANLSDCTCTVTNVNCLPAGRV